MKKTRTFVDANLLIAAARGKPDARISAMKVLNDPNREFASSKFLSLEVLPKALFNLKQDEAAFYQAFFDDVVAWAEPVPALVEEAHRHAVSHGLAAMDALHIAAATALGVEEFLTGEKPDKPFFRVKHIKITSIRPTVDGA